jgi:hypothetical protein
MAAGSFSAAGWAFNRGYSLQAPGDFDNTFSNGAPCVGMDASGRAIGVWSRDNAGIVQKPGSKLGVFAARYTPSGGWADTETVASVRSSDGSNTTLFAGAACVAVNRSGAAMAVWVQTGTAAGQMMFASGSTTGAWSAAAPVPGAQVGLPVSQPVIARTSPVLAIDAAGRVLAAWVTPMGELQASRYMPGSGWSAEPAHLTIGTQGVVTYARIAVDDTGRGVLLWRQIGPRGGVWASVVDASTARWGEPQRLDIAADASGADKLHPPIALSVNASGQGRALWLVAAPGLEDAELYSARLLPGALRFEPTEPVFPKQGVAASQPDLAVDAQGRAVLAFVNRATGAPSSVGSATYTPARGFTRLPDIAPLDAGAGGVPRPLAADHPAAALGDDGRAHLVWSESRCETSADGSFCTRAVRAVASR